jgi:hypothetical protein
MININVNLATGTAALAQTTAIKAGGGVPVRITFSVSPGTNPLIELALSPQSSEPTVLAFLDEFSAQNSTVYTGTLDANDTRLIAHLEGKQAQTLNGELVVTPSGGTRRPFPNFPITVQAPVITGPESSEGGPVYLTDAMLATQEEAEAGTNNSKWMSPLRVAEAIALLGGLPPYLFRGESFEAGFGKAYACDTSGTVEVPAVPPSFTAGGVVFTAKSYPGPEESISISAFSGGGEQIEVGEFHVYTVPDVSTCGEVVTAVNASLDAVFTAALAPGSNANDIFANLDDPFSFAGGSPATTAPAPFEVTLPVPVVVGEERVVVAFCDARGTWGVNPLVILRNGERIEGTEADFVNNAAGTFFAMVYVDSEIGWRVLASGTKPLNLTLPEISGSYAFSATPGTWTGSPTSYAYQWQISDDGETGWADIEGATSASYLATEEQETKFVRVGVIATNANGPSTVAYSAASVEIDIPPFPVTGLMAFWKLADLTDASGNGSTLTNNNGVTFGAGKIGNAAVMDGTNYLGRSMSVDCGADFSVGFWGFANTGAGYNCFVGVNGGSGGIFCHYTGSGTLDANNGYSAELNAPFSENAWHHVVVTKTASTIALYIDGVLEDSSSPLSRGACGDVGIGVAPGSGLELSGKVDAVGIWSRALTAPEIAQLYNGGAGLEPA